MARPCDNTVDGKRVNPCVLKHLFLEGLEQPKISQTKPGNAFFDALLMSCFQNFAADAAKNTTLRAVLINPLIRIGARDSEKLSSTTSSSPSESQQYVVAHRRGRIETRLARGGIREYDAFLGHEMRDPAGTGRGVVSMAGGREGQGTRKRNEVRGHRLPSAPCFV